MSENMQTQNQRIWVSERNANQQLEIAGNVIQMSTIIFPSNEELERMVLSHILASGSMGENIELFKIITGYLYHDDFYFTKHSIIYKAMAHIIARGDGIDSQSVITELRKRVSNKSDALTFVGGEKEIYNMANAIPKNTETHAREVVRISLRRSVMLFGQVMTQLGQRADVQMEHMAMKIHESYQDLNARVSMLTTNTQFDMEDKMPIYIQKLIADSRDPRHESGIKIWIPLLNQMLLGWRKHRLYLIAAGTGIGKTAFMMSAAFEALRQGKKVLFITLEMPFEQLIERLISMASGIDGLRIQKRELRESDIEIIQKTGQEISGYLETGLFIIEEMNNPSMYEIEGKIDYHRNLGLDVIFIDYLGTEMTRYATQPLPGQGLSIVPKYPGSTEHANHIWTEMRRIKLEKPYPFIVGAQVNRSYMNRESKRPNKTDIANSSKAENAADALLILHRESAVGVGIGVPGHADISVEKNRSGPGGDGTRIDLKFDLSTTKFGEWEQAPIVGTKS